MAQGQVPNVIEHQALWPHKVFRRIRLDTVGEGVDALGGLLEAAGPGVGSLQLQSLRKLLPQRQLKRVVFVIAIGFVPSSGRSYSQGWYAEKAIRGRIGGDTGDR